MSTDKPLADVQPGGRVRLSDVLPEDVAQALATVNEVANDARHAGNYRVANALVHARVALSKQLLALSARQPAAAVPQGCDACHRTGIRRNDEGRNVFCPDCDLGAAYAGDAVQPSPGGQGDTLELLEAYDQAVEDLSAERSDGWNEDNRRPQLEADVAELRAELVAALAARQSVGEPVAEAIEQLADDVESCVSDACGYLASDSGWDDYGIYRDDAAARYRALPDRIRALAAAPAQAVDLGHLQRVDPEIHHDANGAYGEMTPNDDGEWVRFSDVESLLIGRKGGR